jgi:hypothetical protein
LGHEAASHAQWPLALQACPAPHAAQTAPPAPHEPVDSLDSASQVPALQQPAQAVPPHVHAPPEHDSPFAHIPHAEPPTPQADPDCAPGRTHVLPLQQPLGHDVASQTHWPAAVLHSWPEAQVPHAAPFVPHDPVDCDAYGSQSPERPPLQQPFGQLTSSHSQMPLVVSHAALGHARHALPPRPHCVADCEAKGTHVPAALQQPSAHVVGLQGGAASACASAASCWLTSEVTSGPVPRSPVTSSGPSETVASPSLESWPESPPFEPSAASGPGFASPPPSAAAPSPAPVMSLTPRMLVHAVAPSVSAMKMAARPHRLRPFIGVSAPLAQKVP